MASPTSKAGPQILVPPVLVVEVGCVVVDEDDAEVEGTGD